MSTPFPLEEQAQNDGATVPWDPHAGPAWYSGIGFNEDTAYLGPLARAIQGAGGGVAKGEEMLGGLWHSELAGIGAVAQRAGLPRVAQAAQESVQDTDSIMADARERVKALTPDSTTVGTAGQLISGVTSGFASMGLGVMTGAGALGAAGVMGGSEGVDRAQELQEQGVSKGTASVAGAVTGVLSGLGAVLPAGFGSTLLSKVLTGAGANAAFGVLGRYADHTILDKAGYHDMADQQKVWDAGSLATDLILGGSFGALAHAHEGPEHAQPKPQETNVLRDAPGVEDAALTMNLAMRDKGAAPGVAADPQSASAHQAALEEATASLLANKPVDVSDAGLDDATFVGRPAPDTSNALSLYVKALRDGGMLSEQRHLDQLESALGARLRGEVATQEAVEPAPVGQPAPVTESGVSQEPTPAVQPSSFNYHGVQEPASANVVTDKGVAVEMRRAFGGQYGFYVDGEKVGRMDYHPTPDGDWKAHIEVSPKMQRKGIASAAYDYVEKNITGKPFVQAGGQSAAGAAFRQARTERPYLPSEPEIAATGAVHTPENASRVATVARALELDQNRVGDLAKHHSGDADGFVKAAKALIDEHESNTSGSAVSRGQAQPSGESAAGQPGAEPGERGGSAAGSADTGATASADVRGAGAAADRPAADAARPAAATGDADRVDGPTYYHGTRSDFSDAFDLQQSKSGDLVGHYFADSEAGARRWADIWSKGEGNARVIKAKLDLKRPASREDVKAAQKELGTDWTREQLTAALKAKGFDGYKDGNETVAFDSSQVRRLGGDPLADPAHQAVQENPDMQIPAEDGGTTGAARALETADHAAAEGEQEWPKAMQALTTCVARFGTGS